MARHFGAQGRAPTSPQAGDAIKETVASPEFAEAGKTLGFRPAFLAGKDFEALIAADDKKVAALMDKLGLKKSK